MSDSPPSEPGAGEPSRRGGWQDIEDGVAALFASLEQGVLNIVDAERAKKSGASHAHADAEDDADAQGAGGLPIDEDGSAAIRRGSARHSTEPEPTVASSDRGADDVEAPPVAPRPGATYDEVLQPIRWGRVVTGSLAVLVLAALYWAVGLAQVVVAADDSDQGTADAIVVLGAAQFDGTPSPVFAARLDRALELWGADRAALIMTTGSSQEGDRFTEGFSGFVYLRDAGVPETSILTIVDGADSYEQLTAAQAQLADRDLSTALLVSDGYHSFRLRAIADEIGLPVTVAPTDTKSTIDDYVRESLAVSAGRVVGYRRLSAWNTVDEDPVDEEDPADEDPAGEEGPDE